MLSHLHAELDFYVSQHKMMLPLYFFNKNKDELNYSFCLIKILRNIKSESEILTEIE
jgi:hypothetical protein|tara:strand:+ start:256 stop:426 length:171 start_codon:yes stop_codon:yes gene_type:complete